MQRLLHDVIDMIQPMIPALARMEIREAIRTLLLAFQKLLRRDDSLYLKVVRQSLNVDLKDHISLISQSLQQLIMQHVLNNPEHMRLTHLGPMTYIFINGGIFTVVRHLSEPNPSVSYEELVNGLADMVGHYVEREMQLLTERDQTSR